MGVERQEMESRTTWCISFSSVPFSTLRNKWKMKLIFSEFGYIVIEIFHFLKFKMEQEKTEKNHIVLLSTSC